VATSASRAFRALAAAGAGAAAWGLFESQWVESGEVDVPVAGLPAALDGLTVLHVSDLHAGTPSLNMRAFRKAVDYGVECDPDLVVLTGDIVSHPRAVGPVITELERLRPRTRLIEKPYSLVLLVETLEEMLLDSGAGAASQNLHS